MIVGSVCFSVPAPPTAPVSKLSNLPSCNKVKIRSSREGAQVLGSHAPLLPAGRETCGGQPGLLVSKEGCGTMVFWAQLQLLRAGRSTGRGDPNQNRHLSAQRPRSGRLRGSPHWFSTGQSALQPPSLIKRGVSHPNECCKDSWPLSSPGDLRTELESQVALPVTEALATVWNLPAGRGSRSHIESPKVTARQRRSHGDPKFSHRPQVVNLIVEAQRREARMTAADRLRTGHNGAAIPAVAGVCGSRRQVEEVPFCTHAICPFYSRVTCNL